MEHEDKCKVALIGAGAVGAYYIWGFHEAGNVDFTLIAEGDRLERIRQHGIRINGACYHPSVRCPQAAGVQDLILIATKYSGLQDAIAMLPAMIGTHTLVLSLLNGVDSEEILAQRIGWEHVEYSMMRIASKRDADGIVFNPEITQGLYVGSGKLSKKILDCLAGSKIRYTLEKDMLRDIWVKYASNIANNLPQAVLGTDASLYIDSEHGKYLAAKLWNEVYAVAKSRNIDIGKEPMIFTAAPKTSKYSTLQDLEAGRHTEIEMFAGVLMKMAEAAEISVPFTEYTYHAIKALEEKNDGVIGC